MTIKASEKIAREKKIANLMIKLYCENNHQGVGLCLDCSDLSDYVEKKIDNCPFIEVKTFCSNCQVHCYNKPMREKIKIVMKYSGPRMIIYHPIIAIDHSYQSIKRKIRNKFLKGRVYDKH